FRLANAETPISGFGGARTLRGQVAHSGHRWLIASATAGRWCRLKRPNWRKSPTSILPQPARFGSDLRSVAEGMLHPRDQITQRTVTVELGDIVAWPRCRSRLALADRRWVCTNLACASARVGFPTAASQPVLADFDNSVFRRADYQDDPNAPV